MNADEFAAVVRAWLQTARHPGARRPYTELVYQPMLELLAYLRANGFKTYIVSGGGVEFIRVFSEQRYGVPPEQVIGSTIKTRYEVRDGRPAIVRLPEVDFIDDKAGKPVAIHKFIGKRPIAAFGNSDGDFEMLEYVTSAPGARLGLIVRHDDAEREWAYDRKSHVGRLDRALDEAAQRGWTITSMKREWKTIYPPGR
jgi:phosphoserine phosphatase